MKEAALAIAAMLALGSPAGRLAAAPAPSWQVDWGDDVCSLIRVPDRPGSILLAIRVTPGADWVSINLIHKKYAWANTGKAVDVALSLDPGGAVPADAAFSPSALGQGPSLHLSPTDDRAFLGQLAAARSLTVTQHGAPVASYTLPSVGQAVAALHACERDALTEWGIDADAWFRLGSGPVPTPSLASLVSWTDFPSKAYDVSSHVVARLAVDETGKPTACVPLRGDQLVADQTCAIFMKRARFKPALDANGQAVAAPYVARLTWLSGE